MFGMKEISSSPSEQEVTKMESEELEGDIIFLGGTSLQDLL
jgi:hypothetical protein